MVLPVILSGGVGARLWPISRQLHPKPFITLADGESLLQKTYKRCSGIASSDEVVVITNRELFFYSRDELERADAPTKKNTFILEPVGRNSTAAIAAASHYALEEYGGDCILLVMPADHLIANVEAFYKAVERAKVFASTGKLATFGITPASAETGYGYILANGDRVEQFVEKPDKETAEQYISDGNYFWNSGMFCMSAASFLEELSLYSPDIAEQTGKAVARAHRSWGSNQTPGINQQQSKKSWQQLEMQHSDFAPIASISVDYAVFEKSQNIAIVPCDIGWSDIGSWNELGALYPSDEQHNSILGKAICQETHDCIIHGSNRLIAALGVKDLLISDTDDALLVAHKDHLQGIRGIVDALKQHEDPVYKEFPRVYRPWGAYTVLQEGTGFRLKNIEVKPGAYLRLQAHKYRSEHWVVVSGTALVANEDELIELQPNQSTYIPSGNKHRLSNPGGEQLVIIEIQCGEYVGEDDIVYYEDKHD